MRFLIVYGTTDGMTAQIAERLGEAIRRLGHQAAVVDAALDPRVDVRQYGGVLIGASLHAGGYQRAVRRFVREQLPALSERPSAFFSVCLAIASKHEQEREEAWRIARAFPPDLGWQPEQIDVVAGALMFSRYGFWRRLVMRVIARKELGAKVDPSRDLVFTDWEAVDEMAARFVALAVSPRRRAPEAEAAAPQ